MNHVLNFLKGLFDSKGNVSSKRVAGMEVLQVCIIMVLASQFSSYKLDYAVLITFRDEYGAGPKKYGGKKRCCF
jgi:hypothetical protein